MTRGPALAVDEGLEERKRLGQFFTGEPLARLLAALAEADQARAIIDPMAGSGDMLDAARQVGSTDAPLTAVEIDSLAASRCAERLELGNQPAVTTVVGDAFSTETWDKAGSRVWDLVITNPPYVRYQRTSHRGIGRVALPSATDVRQGLLAILDERPNLTPDEREVFRSLAAGYSGLADLAVPSWLLCASLVSTGGRLAMVVPDTWLSRDYAIAVLYLLRRYFEVEFVVEDGDASWFEEALVRTTLLVARRVQDRGTALHNGDTGHLHVRLDPPAADGTSLVGALYPGARFPECDFAQQAHTLRISRGSQEAPGLSAGWVPDDEFRELVAGCTQRLCWISELEPDCSNGSPTTTASRTSVHIPRQVREVLGDAVLQVGTLADYGWQVGQGLRTGANRFFYGEFVSETDGATLLAVDPEISPEPLPVPNELLRVAVRKQQDRVLAAGVLHRSPGRLIVLGDHALREDIAATERELGRCPYRPIPEPLAEHVRRAAEFDMGTPDAPRRLPELSAVVTNVRQADPARPDRAPRFWYQLPPLAPRHVPDLFIPRVNYGHPLTTSNPDGVVIDANFSTMWRERDDALSSHALLALLHSTWALAVLEASGTVLGGGALKVEASHLRRLPLPAVRAAEVRRLEGLGAQLSMGSASEHEKVVRATDQIVWKGVLRSDTDLGPMIRAIGNFAAESKARRSPLHRG